ncbi:hypothetical protein DUI87_03291 [Hirundo rustica rustica]|uniref:Reverse transcriptase domain-containing protein n=1 Tax=Hirundo rustica rustica TaxID=333673 RepID=A0A3M0LKU3_HIRRU|nr:hypothetical protein DUI87_03291 [Hirundo rustica rustica]
MRRGLTELIEQPASDSGVFKNSPTLFGEQLAKDLESWEAPPEEGKLLQYVDDILIATRTKEACVAWTVSLLNFLGLQGGNQGEPVHHDCLETIEASYSSRPDLKDAPLMMQKPGSLMGAATSSVESDMLVRAAAGEAIILHYMDDVLVCAPNDDLLSHVLDPTIDSLVAAGFELQEEKIQRMPPWMYLGLEIGKLTIVPQILAVKNNIRTLADVQQLCGSLNWVLLMTEAAIRTKERGWIHASRIKGPVDKPKEWTITSEPGDTKLTLKRGLGGNELGRPKWSKKHTQDHT